MAQPPLPPACRHRPDAGWNCPYSAPSRSRTFVAKLWLLVNDPRVLSVRWDTRGEGLLIDQGLFEREVLGAGYGAAGEVKVFKTKKFASIIRQLNLYGFHKQPMQPSGSAERQRPGLPTAADGAGNPHGPQHHFWNPSFRYGRPDLLVHVRRLTKANKEKLDAVPDWHSHLPNDGRHTALQGCVPPPSTG